MSIIDIDERVLDQQWLEHPTLVYESAEKKADADHAVKQAKDRLSLTRAKTRLRVRQDPARFGLPDRCTTDDVEAAVEASAKYQAALSELREAERGAAHWSALMEALDHRRTAMSKTVELWQMGLRSAPRAGLPRGREGRT